MILITTCDSQGLEAVRMPFSIFTSCFRQAHMEVKMVIVIFQEEDVSKASCDSKVTEKSGRLQVDTGAWKDPGEIRQPGPQDA